MSGATRAAERADAWGVPSPSPAAGRCKGVALAVLLAPAVVFGAAGYGFWGARGLVPALVALVVAYLIVRTSTSALREQLAPRPADDARLLNIVSGLSTELGRVTPPTFIVRGEGVNAILFWNRAPALGITAEAARDLARTELEAMVAHCLVRLDRSGGLDRYALTLGGVFGACGRGVTEIDDARAAAITRYPPALAKAIEKATPARGRFSYLWFAAEGRSHASSRGRVEALGDL